LLNAILISCPVFQNFFPLHENSDGMDIIVENLTKTYGVQKAVDDISFRVKTGEVLGFLGPNGAGKTTTMKAITTYLMPTQGDVRVGRFSIYNDPDEIKRQIGYLPENNPLYQEMPVIDYLKYVAKLQGIEKSKVKESILNMVDLCGLEGEKHKKIGELSKGYKQRVGLAQALIHDPKVLILDEPTSGLDPNQKYEVRAMIREMAREKTVILSTHILEEVDEVCTRAVIISGGHIVADDTPAGLRKKSPIHGSLRFTVKNETDRDVVAEMTALPHVRKAEKLDASGTDVSVRVYSEDIDSPPADEVLAYLHKEGIRIEGFRVEEGRLDEVFRMVTSPDTMEKTV